MKPQRFTAHGLVVASTPRTLRVITRSLTVGTVTLTIAFAFDHHNHRPADHRRHRSHARRTDTSPPV